MKVLTAVGAMVWCGEKASKKKTEYAAVGQRALKRICSGQRRMRKKQTRDGREDIVCGIEDDR